ncbi:MAG: NCS2 family permease [Phycisphaeraceae bacterium]
MLERLFRLEENRTTIRTEVLAGITTFVTMAYIIFVQPAMLSGKMSGTETGMDAGAVLTATCLASALATLIMGLWARYPIALAPGMGVNAFFAFTLLPAVAATGHDQPWAVGLGVVFVSGCLFLMLTVLGVREKIMDAISPSLKHAIAAGIGLFIAFIGLKNAGLIEGHPATLVSLHENLFSFDLIVFYVGLLVAASLYALNVSGSMLIGIAAATLTAAALKIGLPMLPEGWNTTEDPIPGFVLAGDIIAQPPSLEPTLFQLDLAAVFTRQVMPFVIVFLFIDMFDTIGTLIGITQRAGLMKDGRLPRAGRALGADAIGTVTGACLGTSTVTSYVESGAGVEQGGRTGLTAVTVAVLFLASMWFWPVIDMVGAYPPITAGALVLVGVMMLRGVVHIAWDDLTEALPAFLIVVGIPLTFSIGDGIAMGFMAYPILKLLTGQARHLKPLMMVLAMLLILYFFFVRSGL